MRFPRGLTPRTLDDLAAVALYDGGGSSGEQRDYLDGLAASLRAEADAMRARLFGGDVCDPDWESCRLPAHAIVIAEPIDLWTPVTFYLPGCM